MDSDQARLTQAQLRTPRAAAVAGILFSVLLFVAFGLMRISVPGDPFEPGTWLESSLAHVTLAMNLVPFAGIAFLWFVGVLRDRLGAREDQFFATVFLGSGLLLLAMLFAAAAVVGADHYRISCRPRSAGALRDLSFRTRPGLWDDQYLPGEDGFGLHDHDIDHSALHAFDTPLARNRGIRRRDRSPDRELLSRLEPDGLSVVGYVSQRVHSA
jgi:hypothetical protein